MCFMGAKLDMPIPLPPLEEQREIVRRVERLLSLGDSFRSRV